MNKIDWKRKLSSRKFWAMAATFALACVVALGGSAELGDKIVGVITAGGACIAYILAEAKVDAANKEDE